ncbi:putative F-box/FBD/LRR-repeat protein [Camellia lanceoleosa]|nr:putative F-box/FBD/LRR-repeat protein [Camellia lanceoleosa]
METRSAKKKRLLKTENETETGEDWISDLPDAVLHHILFLLPIKSIAQTSVLSKRWRSIWSSFPDLDFTTTTNSVGHFSSTIIKYSSTRERVHSPLAQGMDFIIPVLALRDKNSDLRILRFCAQLSFSRLISLIRCAVRRNVQELAIGVAADDYFNPPRCVTPCESLRVFKLKSRYPGIRLPPLSIMKSGFQSLHTLSLSLVILYQQSSLVDLFTASSFLFSRTPRLKIIRWEYNAITESSCLENLNSLHEASVGFFVLHDDITVAKRWSISNFLTGLSHVESLTLESQCVEILSKNKHFASILNPFNKLKTLELCTGFNKHNIPALACLFRSSSNLHTLIIKIANDYKIEGDLYFDDSSLFQQWNRELWDLSNSGEERYWDLQTQALKFFLHNLKVVKIQGFSECENDISLAKFLLKHGKVLEEMIICPGHYNSRDTHRRERIKSQMMEFSRASSNAKIAFQ